MNDRNLDQLLSAWMGLGPSSAPDRVADAARLEARATRQTAALRWWPLRRFPEMNGFAKLSIAAVAVVVAVVVSINLLPGAGGLGNGGRATPDVTASPAASSPGPIPLNYGERDIDPGTYTVDDAFPLRITFDVPAGFRSCSPDETQQAVCGLPSTEAPSGRGVAFWIVDNVVTDPCRSAPHDPPVGPSVDDLVEALSSLPGFTATAPVDVTIDGQSGKQIELTAPTDAGCALQTWSTSHDTNGVGPGERNLLWVGEVDGVRLMISMAYFPDDTPQSVLDELQAIVDSVRFD